MGKNPADQFYWGDWLNDVELQAVSACSRGVWINALCRMWYASVRGELVGTEEVLAKICNATKAEFDTFFQEAQMSRFCHALCNGDGVVTLRNRRMFRNEKGKENHRLRQEKYRKKLKSDGVCDGKVTHPSSSSSSKNPYSPQTPYQKIVEYLNKKTGKNFKWKAKETQIKIRARWKDGFRLEDFKYVIDLKCSQWLQDKEMVKFLRPETLFGTKFEGYKNEPKPEPKSRLIS